MMVGVNISDEQLGGIAQRAIDDADQDNDGMISFEELSKVQCGRPGSRSATVDRSLLFR